MKVDSPGPFPYRLRGNRKGFEIVVTRTGTGILARVLGVDPWFTLGKDSARARAIRPDIETGDEHFDELVRVEGDRDFALGLLEPEVRVAALEVVETLGGNVRGGKIEVRVARIQKLTVVLPPMLHLANLLRRPVVRDLAPRLARSALEDPSQGFRLRAFQRLTRSFHGTQELLSTAKHLLHSSRGELRLEAARILVDGEDPKDRQAASDALAEMAASRKLEAWPRRAALEELILAGQADDALRVARRLLRRREERTEMRSAAISAVVEVGTIEDLLELDPPEGSTWAPSEHEAESLGEGRGRLGDARAQPRLVELLRHPSDSVRLAAARALGVLGDADAVRPLRDLADPGSLLQSAVSRAAESAIDRIQARLGGSQAGEISLADSGPLEGAVSPAEDDEDDKTDELAGGEVSLAD